MSIDGLILVDKPEGVTSFGTDILMRKIAGTKKVGHLGTLDPFATGLLPVFAGKGLKYLRYCDAYDKGYSCEAMFGATTDTMDLTGEVIAENYPTEDELAQLEATNYEPIRKAFEEVAATKLQMPPKYSAKKIDGRKACDMARSGEEFELKPNKIEIYKLTITSIRREGRGFVVSFDTLCSKGTYIRTICDDCGKLTGYGAHALSLRRTVNGPFTADMAYTPDKLAEMVASGDYSFVRPAMEAIEFIPKVELNAAQARQIRDGKKIPFPQPEKVMNTTNPTPKDLYRAMYGDNLIAVIYPEIDDGKLITRVERGFADA